MRFDDTPSHNVTNAVIYCRVSSKAQAKRGDGLNSQEARCRQYAAFKGYNVMRVFSDDLTGQSAERPGLNALLSFLQADRRNPHVVIIDDLSRFARRVAVHFKLRETIALSGGILESPSVEFRDDADGEFHEHILASAAQHQARKNAEQTRNRMEARCLNGFWPFHAPIGYKHVSVKGCGGKALVPDEPVASIIREGLEGYASGRFDSQAEVKRFFERQPDFPKDLPNGEIRNQRINDILKRVIYAGYIEVPNWDIPLRKARHEGLITLETHEKIQDRLAGNKKAPARKDINADFALRGFVLCGTCDKPLTACWSKSKTGRKHPYYLCFNRQCEDNRKSIPRDRLEGEFEDILLKMKPSENLFQLAKAMFRDAWDQRLAQAKAEKAAGKKEIARIERQIEQLVDRIVDSGSETAIKAYEARIAKLEKEKLLAAERLETGTEPARSFDEMFELALAFLANPSKLWASERLEDKRTVLKLTFAERLAYRRNSGFRTPKPALPFKALKSFRMNENGMAGHAR